MTLDPTNASPTSAATQGIAGRTNYAQWDKLATDLVEQVEAQDQEEEQEENAKLGLDGKYALSQADKEEREKSATAKKTKAQLDAFREREDQLVLTIADRHDEKEIILTPGDFPKEKRVLRIAHCTHCTIVLSPEISLLASPVPSNMNAKTFDEDAENTVEEKAANAARSILGLIKVFVEGVSHVHIKVHCKIITGCMEFHQCDNTKVTVTTRLPTIQTDLCQDMNIIHHNCDPTDRILHAGCDRLTVAVHQANKTHSVVCNYLADGAVSIGNATPEEYQFVTTFKDSKFSTVPVQDTTPPPTVDKATSLQARGNEAFGAGEYAQAILHYSMAIDQNDTLDVLYSNRAACFLKLGEHEKAQADAERALERNPSNVKAMFRCGLALHAAGKYRQALDYLGPAAKKQPHNKQIQQALKFSEVRMEQEMRKRMEKK